MKKIKNFQDYSVNELSKDLIDRTANIMTSRNQPNRAKKLIDTYNDTNYDFKQFINKPIFDDEYIINIKIQKDNDTGKNQIILYISNRQQYNTSNHSICYSIDEDKYLWLPHKSRVSRKDVRLLGKIAAIVNPDTQYKTGTGDIEVGDY